MCAAVARPSASGWSTSERANVCSQDHFRRRNSCETVNSFTPANSLNLRDSGFRYRSGAVNSFRRISARREGFSPASTAVRSTASVCEGRGSWGISGRDARPEMGFRGQVGGGKGTGVQPSLCRGRNDRRGFVQKAPHRMKEAEGRKSAFVEHRYSQNSDHSSSSFEWSRRSPELVFGFATSGGDAAATGWGRIVFPETVFRADACVACPFP